MNKKTLTDKEGKFLIITLFFSWAIFWIIYLFFKKLNHIPKDLVIIIGVMTFLIVGYVLYRIFGGRNLLLIEKPKVAKTHEGVTE